VLQCNEYSNGYRPGTDREAAFYFSGARLSSITFKRKTLYWKLPADIHVGMSVDEIQRLNGTSFIINHLETYASGLVLNWNGGRFDKDNVSMEFTSTKNEMIYEEYMQLSEMNSSDKNLRKLGLVVKEITLINPDAK
jgi:hypothetical protein